eukprot:gb/GEZN01016655.1/.p1 GENE.gb/GEZN01016655.1/~~gb/GEZN01016655.1/.p1  ORF type:complete len:240 (+),score=26.96 gb/GEZN01016655.1/:30-722(+)
MCCSGRKRSRFALLIVDVQNDFMPPKGSLAVAGGLDTIPVINDLRQNYQWNLIALTQDWHLPTHVSFHSNNPGSTLFQPHKLASGEEQVMWPDHCVQGSEGAKFHKDLVVHKTDSIIRKGTLQHVDSYSGFYDNDHKTRSTMADKLKQQRITDIMMCGVAYDYCVGFSALDAINEGFHVWVVEDAVRGVAPDSTKAMKEKMIKHNVKIIQAKDVCSLVPKSTAKEKTKGA